MVDFFKKIKGLEGLDTSKVLSGIKMIDPVQQASDRVQEDHKERMRIFEQSKRKKELEETRKENEEERRHSEQMEELKNLKIMVNNFGDNATGVQIQQGVQNSTQKLSITQEFNYEKASEVLNQIKGYFDIPIFNTEFGDKAEEVKQIVNQTLEQVKSKDDPTLIKKALAVIYDIAIRVTSGVIATGIVGLIGKLLT